MKLTQIVPNHAKLVLTLVTLLSTLVTLPAHSKDFTETEDAVHIAAHFGLSYGLTHAGEVVCVKLTQQSKLACTIQSALLANALNIGRKVAQGRPSDTKRAVISGLAGSVAAGVFIQLDF